MRSPFQRVRSVSIVALTRSAASSGAYGTPICPRRSGSAEPRPRRMRSGAISSSELMVIAMSTGWRVNGLSAPRPTLSSATWDATPVAYVTASRSKYESWNHTESSPRSRAARAHSTVSATSPRAARPRPTRRARLAMRRTAVQSAERAVDPRERLVLAQQLERIEQGRPRLAAGDRDPHRMGRVAHLPAELLVRAAHDRLDLRRSERPDGPQRFRGSRERVGRGGAVAALRHEKLGGVGHVIEEEREL